MLLEDTNVLAIPWVIFYVKIASFPENLVGEKKKVEIWKIESK